MTPQQADELMKQIRWMYELWANPREDADDVSIALNRLFAIAKDIDESGMHAAFEAGKTAFRTTP